MSDLTDLEICKRIAEIVGCPYDDGLIQAYGNWINPLLDTMRAKAFCFDLMVAYAGTYESQTLYAFSKANPNKAILLAIIKANSNDK